MKFKREDLADMAYDDGKKLTKVEDNITNHGRWSVSHSVVFKDCESGKHYRSYYSVGATESQCESAYEYADDEVECAEVTLKEVTIESWVEV